MADLMPTATKIVPVSRPDLGPAELDAVARVLASGWVAMGPETERFEAEFAAFTDARFACAVSSGTAALHVALKSLGIGPGDEVITASHSFIATASAIRLCGALPVFVDIDPQTFNLDPLLIEPAIGPRTRAILCVHQMGMPCDLKAILKLARARGIPVVEDAACAAGSEILWENEWQRIGRPHGEIACFSFHPRKTMTTGEGGMLTTNDPHLDARFRLQRNHGMSVPAHDRHSSPRVISESYDALGWNYRLSDVQSAIGRVQLRRLPEFVTRRRVLASVYRRLLAENPEVTAPVEPSWARTNWQSYCVRLAADLDQRAVMQELLDQGVATRRGVMCAHREPAYPEGTWRAAGNLRHSEDAQDRTIWIPLATGMSEEEAAFVAECLGRVCRR